MRAIPLLVALGSCLSPLARAGTLPTTASVSLSTHTSEPGMRVAHTVTRGPDGDRIVWSRQRDGDATPYDHGELALGSDDFAQVWAVVEQSALTRFPADGIPGSSIVDGGQTTLSLHWDGQEHTASWSQPVQGEEAIVALRDAFTFLIARHEQPADGAARPDLSHVQVGQRYVYEQTRRGAPDGERVLEVIEVNALSVRYRHSAAHDASPSHAADSQLWTFQSHPAEQHAARPLVPMAPVTVSGVTLDVFRYGSDRIWTERAYQGGQPTFPPSVARAGGERSARLVSIEPAP